VPQGNTEDVGEDFNVEAADDAPRPFQCILDTGLKRTSTGSKVGGAQCRGLVLRAVGLVDLVGLMARVVQLVARVVGLVARLAALVGWWQG
jgi:hypothetical protein